MLDTIAKPKPLTIGADFEQWNRIVDACQCPDIYYRVGYVKANESAGHGSAIGLHLQTATCHWLLPLHLRPLSDLSFACNLPARDAISPYGYGGILCSSGQHVPAEEETASFVDTLLGWCSDNNVVAVLCRLHPLFHQPEWFKALAGRSPNLTVKYHGPTTAIELGNWDEADCAPAGLAKGRRSDLRFARRALQVTVTENTFRTDAGTRTSHEPDVELAVFKEIYDQTMMRLSASQYYLFPAAYYRELWNGLPGKMCVAVARRNQEPVAASIFFADTVYAHYHLSGATDSGRANKASTLLVAAGAEWARQRGCKLLHLGGGIRGEDPLFNFKRSFGGPVFQYHYLTAIADGRQYQSLQRLRMADANLPPPRPNYFPAYRA